VTAVSLIASDNHLVAKKCRIGHQHVHDRNVVNDMTDKAFEQKLARYPLRVQAVARKTRALVLSALPKVEETIDPSAPVVGYSYGPGYKGLICTLILSQAGTKLGLTDSAALPDPLKLLRGSGKKHRYVPITTAADLRKPGLRELLEAADARRRDRNR